MVDPTHFGDPCIHCAIPHDDVPAGPCQGDPEKAIPIAYRSFGVRWDNIEHFLILYSDGQLEDRWCHITEDAPYWHFGKSDHLKSPPRYDACLRRAPAHA